MDASDVIAEIQKVCPVDGVTVRGSEIDIQFSANTTPEMKSVARALAASIDMVGTKAKRIEPLTDVEILWLREQMKAKTNAGTI